MQCLLRAGFRCRASIPVRNQWMSLRCRSTKTNTRPKIQPRTLPLPPSLNSPVESDTRTSKDGWNTNPTVPTTLTIQQDRIIPFFKNNVSTWVDHPETLLRLTSFGLPIDDSKHLLDEFIRDVQSDSLSDPENYAYYGLERFGHTNDPSSIETIYSTIFFSWASKHDPEHMCRIEANTKVSSSTMSLIKQLSSAMNRQFPTDEFEKARSMHRKIIMHVGPTNSGKTHHALRALAAAKSGVYAGPLRLLAHEIWERLNTGQIAPLGIEDNLDDSNQSKGTQSKYARLCNLVTGEEQKILDPNAPLLSCTVEMLLYSRVYDVAVVDEIQMIGDLERGGAWFTAVAGLAAHEVHLCGEETAVPLVEKLLKDTGDELIVRRYKRLTPLVIESESLGGDLTKVRKGDCIVTFSRSSIFGIKRQVEEKTGLRCAVVYGRLPPEVRSEQAALFNDPNSGYDVIIGSDAIGMGLNLKIRRVIFEAVSKFKPGGFVYLSVSTVKQIAGRAGRYGLHDGGEPGGTCTTLHANDHSYLRQCLAAPYVPLEFTRIGATTDTVTTAMNVLPPNASLHTVIDAHSYIGRIPTFMRYASRSDYHVFDYVDRYWTGMNIADRMMLLFAPIPWRDVATTEIILRFLNMHSSAMSVDFMEGIKKTGHLETMLKVEDDMVKKSPHSHIDTLMRLESFHKIIVFYVWMSFRSPVVYSEFLMVADLKLRLEKVLNWSLEGLSKNQNLLGLAKGVTSRPMGSAKYLTRQDVRTERGKGRQKPTLAFNPTQNVAPPSIAG
ncbi:P-loop containing nucleoside triphosphate hydrolase protein [Phlegmacium glaucopus]|nr:P-loop containing nucleoside triphosphate hydrolase protein [Phlegmacium glaucopus]